MVALTLRVRKPILMMRMDEGDGFGVCGGLLLKALAIANILIDSKTLIKIGQSTKRLCPMSGREVK